MVGPDRTPTPSLIQQRIALERARIIAWVLVIGLALSNAGLLYVTIRDGGPWYVIVPLLILGYFGYQAVLAHRSLRAFEREHGRDAGRQHPVGR